MDARIGFMGVCRQQIAGQVRIFCKDLLHGIVIMDVEQMPVIEPGPFEMPVIHRKAKGPHQIELCPRSCTETGDISRISRNFRFYQHNMHQDAPL